ncbi:MAG: phage tail family protein [Clostridiales bacterium]|nr:phage tail family protein [Clostridiales bacterium]
MQKLIYQNILGETVTFYHAPFVLRRVQGVGLSEMHIGTTAGQEQQGESLRSIRRESRRVKVTLHLMAGNRQEMYRLRSELLGCLSPEKAFDGQRRAKLIYENDYLKRWTWATPEHGLDWGERKQNVLPGLTLSFLCESPFWFGMGEKEIAFREADGGFILPARMPLRLGRKQYDQTLYNGGQISSPVMIRMEGCGEKPKLENLSTGRKIALVEPLPVGDVLEVNTDPAELRAVILRRDGSSENGFGLLNPESSISAFVLEPGENRLKYTAGGQGSSCKVQVHWYERFEGV